MSDPIMSPDEELMRDGTEWVPLSRAEKTVIMGLEKIIKNLEYSNSEKRMQSGSEQKIIQILEDTRKKTTQIESNTKIIMLILLLPILFWVFWYVFLVEVFL